MDKFESSELRSVGVKPHSCRICSSSSRKTRFDFAISLLSAVSVSTDCWRSENRPLRRSRLSRAERLLAMTLRIRFLRTSSGLLESWSSSLVSCSPLSEPPLLPPLTDLPLPLLPRSDSLGSLPRPPPRSELPESPCPEELDSSEAVTIACVMG
jgi:hypothetical protein